MTESGTVVDIEGGSFPAWYLDEAACVHLEESADQMLGRMRDAVRSGDGRLLNPFIPTIKLALHDEGKAKWYASDPVQWAYLSRIDSVLHELRTAEFDEFKSDRRPQHQTSSGSAKVDSTPDPPELSMDEMLKGIPDEDDRNSSLILLMLFTQAYYKMLEATTSISDWLTMADPELNHSYMWTVQNLTNLLNNNKHLGDFPEKFEPIFEDLYPTTIADVEWQLMVAPHADGFLASVQRYVLKKGTYDPEEGSPAWIMVQLFRPGVETAIERAEKYNRRLRKARHQMFGETPSEKTHDSTSKAETETNNVPKADEVQPGTATSNSQIAIPPRARWSEVAMRFLDAHNLQVIFRDQT